MWSLIYHAYFSLRTPLLLRDEIFCALIFTFQ